MRLGLNDVGLVVVFVCICICGGIFNLDGHAQIKKCSHVSGVFTCFSRLTGMAPAQAMTRYLLYGSRNRRPFLLPLGFSPVWGSQVMSPSATALG